ncbi:MAG: ABC-F family ATP-binding cassette domain-containing protein [Clostridia bacterium]|nr:ABC-F family ATP-binding cassette domain-containing protein [Clostridia bacterium]
MSILKISNLSQMFEDKILFKNANLVINNGEHVGIVGLNGAGKSTFINIIAKKIIWDEGEVTWLNGIRYGYLDQHADIDRTQTVYEYLQSSFTHLYEKNDRLTAIYEKMGEVSDDKELEKLINKSNRILEELTDSGFYDIDATIKKTASGLGVTAFGFDTLIANLSGGQRAKLMLTKLILQDLDVMLLDEPTNFLDVEHIDWLVKFLTGYKKTFMVISHDTDFLDKVCDNIVSIENGSIKKYSGAYTSFVAQHEMAVKQYAEEYERQQAEIKKMEDYINRNKARAATAGMANSRKKMLDRIEVMEKPTFIPDATFDFPCNPLHTKEMLVVDNLEIGYDGVPLLPPISFTLQGDTKLWIRGTNGIGKTTLLKTLMRVLKPIGGNFKFHIAAKPSYLEQDLTFRNLNTNAYGYISDCFPRFNQKEVRTQLSRVGITGDNALKEILHLSGGEQVRIRLLTIMNTTSNILILDEPTNHLDVRAKKALSEAIKKYDGAMILVCHERTFAEELCNAVYDVKQR